MGERPTRNSHALLDGPGRAPARAMLKAIGFTDDDLSRPLVGVANTWIEVMPGDLYDATFRGQVSFQDHHASGRFDRVGQ